jgi:two-component system response regulator GlrR
MRQQRVDVAVGNLTLIGNSPPFMSARDELLLAAPYDVNVLIEGETGTGKELFARLLHEHGPRSKGPFVAVNCAAIPPDLAESEFFGHRRGAFTSALEDRPGLISEADAGTLFLDEVSAMDIRLQAKILRFIQEREYRRVGGDRNLTADVRIISASNEHLENAAQNAAFRWDLYYRLSVFPVRIPPLRERGDDILLIFDHLLRKHAKRFSVVPPQLTPSAARVLLAYDWPGNVRQLENIAQGLVIRRPGASIGREDFPPYIVNFRVYPDSSVTSESFQQQKASMVLKFERTYLEELLEQNRGNVSRAARVAGKNRRVLTALLKKHRIDPRAYRDR